LQREPAVSNTEACEGLCAGAACIASAIRPVENQKFLLSLVLLVLLGQAKSTKEKIGFTFFCLVTKESNKEKNKT